MNGFLIAAVLVTLTNMIVNVVKGWGGIFSKNPQILVVVVAELLSCGTAAAWIQSMDTAPVWYHYALGPLGGMVVAYTAMYGYDSLYQDLLNYLKGMMGKQDEEEKK